MVSLVHEALPEGTPLRKRRTDGDPMNRRLHQPAFVAEHRRTYERLSPRARMGVRHLWDIDRDNVQGNSVRMHPVVVPRKYLRNARAVSPDRDLSDSGDSHHGIRRCPAGNSLSFRSCNCRKPGMSCHRAWGHGTVGWLRRPGFTVGTLGLNHPRRNRNVSASGTVP